MYHHYTVDEHLIRTVGIVSEIERGESAEHASAVARRSSGRSSDRRVLYVAAFLHDIAKGREEDHSTLGARIARPGLPALRPRRRRDRTRRMADRESSRHEQYRAEPRHRRPQDDPRLRRDDAERRAPEAAAGADGGRHPRRRPQHLERLEGPAPAHALLRDGAAAHRRPISQIAASERVAAATGGVPQGGRWPSRPSASRPTSTATIPTTG